MHALHSFRASPITETLERIPAQWRVICHVREKFSCRSCAAITQPPAPFHAIARGRAGAGLLAGVVFNKFGLHLPLHRQSERFAAEGVEIDVSTLADWVGAVSVALKPLVRAALIGSDQRNLVLPCGPTGTSAFGQGRQDTGDDLVGALTLAFQHTQRIAGGTHFVGMGARVADHPAGHRLNLGITATGREIRHIRLRSKRYLRTMRNGMAQDHRVKTLHFAIATCRKRSGLALERNDGGRSLTRAVPVVGQGRNRQLGNQAFQPTDVDQDGLDVLETRRVGRQVAQRLLGMLG